MLQADMSLIRLKPLALAAIVITALPPAGTISTAPSIEVEHPPEPL